MIDLSQILALLRAACGRRRCFGRCSAVRELAAQIIAAGCCFLALVAPAEVRVEWLNGNAVVVSGVGEGGGEGYPQVVITNVIGYCTNCIAATPEQMRTVKFSLQQHISRIYAAADFIERETAAKREDIQVRNDDVANFIRIGLYSTSTPTSSHYLELSNYLAQADNTQASLDKSLSLPTSSTTVHRWPSISNAYARNALIGYNDGIYDYAHTQDTFYDDLDNSLMRIRSASADQLFLASAAADMVIAIPEELCTEITYLPGTLPGDGGGGSSTNVPGIAVEQLDAILEYVRHIDDDAHELREKVEGGTNDLARLRVSFDAFSKLLGSALFQGSGTIVTDSDGNSWSNVYNNGTSQLYDYNKSNVLQRIELLLYGISGIGPTTGDASDQIEYPSGVEEQIDGAAEKGEAAVSGAASDLGAAASDLRRIQDALDGFFDAFSGLGGGSVGGSFTPDISVKYGESNYTVPGLLADSEQVGQLQSWTTPVRVCFQVFYHVTSALFLFFFYRLFLTRFVELLRWVYDIVTGMFGD